MQVQLTTTQWLSLPADVKEQLKATFGLRRSGGSVVHDNRVISDGYEHRDLAVITREVLCAFLGIQDSTDDFFSLFDQVLDKLHAEMDTSLDQAVANLPPIEPEIVFTFGGKLYRAVEIGDAPAGSTVQPLYPSAGQSPVAQTMPQKPKVTRAPRKKAKK